MPRYMIEVPHEAEQLACARAVQILIATGSHYLTHAEYGCRDGVHEAWIVVDAPTRDEARGVLPPAYRRAATITELNRFALAEIEEIIRHHRG